MTTGYITHDEAMIQNFINDPDYADLYLQTVLNDGDEYEIKRVQFWYNEAKARNQALISNMAYWNNVANNAKLAAKDGNNLASILNVLNDALATVKAAMVWEQGQTGL